MTVKTTHGGESTHTMASQSDEAMAESSSSASAAGATVSSVPPAAANRGISGNAQPLTPEQKESVRQVMLERLSTTGAHFAHQQRDSPDLTQQEKISIAAEILHKNPATFLARFGRFLHSSDLRFFQDTDKNNYEVHFHLKEIQHRCSHSEVIVKNRRYAAMKELEAGGDYFSEDEMKRREPLLYEQMIGQFLTEEEQQKQVTDAIDRSDLRFSTILLTHMDDAQRRALYKYQKEKEECQEEEEEEEDSEEEEEEEEEEEKNEHRERKREHCEREMDDDDDEVAEDIPEISDVRATNIRRLQLQEEFRSIMHEKFLSGSDADFDYSKVDDNPDYDSLGTVAQDEEYRYFLSEAPGIVMEDGSDSDKDCKASEAMKMEEEEEEVEDYMLYEPPPDLVAKSAHFVKIGSWTEGENTDS